MQNSICDILRTWKHQHSSKIRPKKNRLEQKTKMNNSRHHRSNGRCRRKNINKRRRNGNKYFIARWQSWSKSSSKKWRQPSYSTNRTIGYFRKCKQKSPQKYKSSHYYTGPTRSVATVLYKSKHAIHAVPFSPNDAIHAISFSTNSNYIYIKTRGTNRTKKIIKLESRDISKLLHNNKCLRYINEALMHTAQYKSTTNMYPHSQSRCTAIIKQTLDHDHLWWITKLIIHIPCMHIRLTSGRTIHIIRYKRSVMYTTSGSIKDQFRNWPILSTH